MRACCQRILTGTADVNRESAWMLLNSGWRSEWAPIQGRWGRTLAPWLAKCLVSRRPLRIRAQLLVTPRLTPFRGQTDVTHVPWRWMQRRACASA